MSIKPNNIKIASLLTVLSLVASVAMTSCKKDKPAAEAPATPTAEAPATPAVAPKAGTALSPTEKSALTPAKTALVMANTAVKAGKMDVVKTQVDKFNGLWKTVGPMIKDKAGDNYPKIESAIGMVTTAVGGTKPDKAKAGEGLTAAMKAIDAVMTKK